MAALPPYRLQALMDLRARKKEEAERALGECIAALKTEQDRLKQMEVELERMVARREAKKREYAEKAMRGEMDARGAVSANLYIDRLKEQEQLQQNAIDGQKGVVEQKKKAVDEAREALVKATQDLKALEKHKEKWAEEIKRERQAKEEETLDELAQTIFLNRDDG